LGGGGEAGRGGGVLRPPIFPWPLPLPLPLLPLGFGFFPFMRTSLMDLVISHQSSVISSIYRSLIIDN
jgi:hypothetical protein